MFQHIKKKIVNNWGLVFVVLMSLLTTWPLFVPGYFSHHDDLQVIRVFEMRKCFSDFQLPCRWSPDMGYGYGFPLFNYYAPLAYYIGGVASYLLGYVMAAKFIFFIPLVLGGVSMYLLGKELFGKWGGIASSVLYTYLPYHALDLFVRGAVAESFAIALIPLVLYFSLRVGREKNIYSLVGLGATFGLFMISHNIMALIFAPFVIAWEGVLTIFRGLKNSVKVLLGYLLGLGLASFFVVPAFFERDIINTSGLTSFELDFRANFLAVGELFKKSWGYILHDSTLRNNMSFQLGWPHVLVVVVSALLILLSLYPTIFKRLKINTPKWNKSTVLLGTLSVFSLGVSLIMTHNKSAPVWEFVDILKYVQFPWRFLSVAGFFASLLGGYCVSAFGEKWAKYLALCIVFFSVILNIGYFKPEKFYSTSDIDKLTGTEYENQQKGAILDYLPKGAREPKKPAPSQVILISGKADVENFKKGSRYWEFALKATDPVSVEVPVFEFPTWNVSVDGKRVEHTKTEWGTVVVNVSSGNHLIRGLFTNTPIRKMANAVSLVSLALLLLVSKYGKNTKLFK